MTWQVLVNGPVDPICPDILREFADVTNRAEYEDREAVLADIARFDAIVAREFAMPREVIERATNLRVVARHGVGVDSVDVEAATERGIVVCNTPGANARAVAEHTITLLLAVRKRLLVADADTRAGEWPREKYMGHEVKGQTYGLFGCGNIGSEVSEIATGLGMDVVAYDPYLDSADAPPAVELVASKAELFETADVVSVHTPLTDETRGAIGADEIGRLSDEGILVTAARGGVVDEAALIDALEAGEIAGAGVDVFEREPPSPDNPLFALDSVVATPHVAGTTVEAHRAKGRRAAENVRTVYEGGIPDSAVNADDL